MKVPPPGERNRDEKEPNRTVSAEMEPTKAVLFGFWGVTVPSSPKDVFTRLEKQHNLPE